MAGWRQAARTAAVSCREPPRLLERTAVSFAPHRSPGTARRYGARIGCSLCGVLGGALHPVIHVRQPRAEIHVHNGVHDDTLHEEHCRESFHRVSHAFRTSSHAAVRAALLERTVWHVSRRRSPGSHCATSPASLARLTSPHGKRPRPSEEGSALQEPGEGRSSSAGGARGRLRVTPYCAEGNNTAMPLDGFTDSIVDLPTADAAAAQPSQTCLNAARRRFGHVIEARHYYGLYRVQRFIGESRCP